MTMLTCAIDTLSRVFGRLNMLPVSRSQNVFCPGSDDGSSSNKSGRWNVSKNFGGILRPESVRRTLVICLIYRPRANKQFDIAF